PSNRDKLLETGRLRNQWVEVLDRERLLVLLESAQGYATRLRYLGIPMSPEEQFSYFADSRERVESHLHQQGYVLGRLEDKIDELLAGGEYVRRTMAVVAERLGETLDMPA